MVLLNTFPISIMNHLLLIIPVQFLFHTVCTCACVHVLKCLCMRVCARVLTHVPKAPNEGIDTAHVTDREQVV